MANFSTAVRTHEVPCWTQCFQRIIETILDCMKPILAVFNKLIERAFGLMKLDNYQLALILKYWLKFKKYVWVAVYVHLKTTTLQGLIR